jgi:hypothetical protein
MHKSKHIMTTFGYGLQLNLATNQFLIFISFSSRKKHVCCREFSLEFDKQIWKAFSFYRCIGTWYPYACKFLNLLLLHLHLHLLLLLLLLLHLQHLQGLQELLHLLLYRSLKVHYSLELFYILLHRND